ncbi:MAG TPA: GNAT family N-acetyltransferase [Pyrinomonadaceae bacterium]|nr:GNAT family N-acetyltransferase [Pyrinomonadaceae bacterium]
MTNGGLRLVPASSVSLAEFAAAFTDGFRGYAVHLDDDAEKLSRRVRADHYDLHHSLVAYDGDERVGMAALAVRGEAGWCGGLAVVPERRGRGVGRLLMRALLEKARAAGVRRLTLEVLAGNTAARRLYEGAGMRVVRELLVLERAEGRDAESSALEGVSLEEAAPSELLPHFARLHTVAPAWQRDLPSLLVAVTRGLRLGPRESPRAYALVSEGRDGKTYLSDLAAEDAGAARELSAGLASVGGALRIINEPEQSLFVAPLLEQGFAETHRQHEMAIELS